MSIYLICIITLIILFIALTTYFVVILLKNKSSGTKSITDNISQKKSSLYIKYSAKTQEILINNYVCLNLEISKHIIKISKNNDFNDKVKSITKNKDDKFEYNYVDNDLVYNFIFSYVDKEDDEIILRCDYNIEKVIVPINMMSMESIKKIHSEQKNKNAAFYYLNIKDFNSINQRYGQNCGDYILNILKSRILKEDRKGVYSSYIGADQFAIYYQGKINKKKAIKFIERILKKIVKPIDVGCINIDINIGVGVCVGDYDDLGEFNKCAYIASDYAKKRKKYNIVIYNESMKLEESTISACEMELTNILEDKEINISYSPIYYYEKNKFIGYKSCFTFRNSLVDYEKIKSVAIKNDKVEQLMNITIDSQLVNYIKKRPNKRSKLFIELKLEDLSSFLEIYLSNPSYSECKIVICLNAKKGYEMINKFSNISSNISKIIEEGIDFAVQINYNNMYDYDYILKNAKYLILDGTIVANMDNSLVINKTINIVELAKNYGLELIATDVNDYVQLENLLKYNVRYFSGMYFGKSSKKISDIELTKTRIFNKLDKDSKENKKN